MLALTTFGRVPFKDMALVHFKAKTATLKPNQKCGLK